ncbi:MULTISPECIES: peptidoglycan DD-metalloendopeptidase family protein [unclassified Pseudomonas]|uniref:peptidoglycan DD-metalloendopeptidase family protein n=1 Tax=unclassified Pseudomonas TaxID=196821 RepID=UPI002AC9443E|nr:MULTISPECIES: peptidoglycan DD-metalloendopeptidase family protein [unclassified Pseudomonas]MEB0039648.1 peptidoglycan DD-metalloendopeptidase family protein [Pseudomonas sp. MH10]MEB0077111.1 peptidoglycan DD-metalloendopeptidase family protein [Pseudomonas sp. MH10out]MEB0089913.1 peptidoglycan DD-metalloendopeptidase family protein [Pseudomonas sp. CCI4.2]MEB0103886.1 peptidoglycan DD-metalloendopeptidase family protein [Pseudomonas sp. CCI3.2]MEB0120132.1 peptidoglycan DD-metalloendope
MSLTVIQQRLSTTSIQRLVIGLVLGFLLVGCSSRSPGNAPVFDRNKVAPQRQAVTTGQYVVRRSDTLFSIAFRYGWDWKALAERNQIPAPYTIHPGQTIRFDGRSSSAPVVASVAHAPQMVTSTTGSAASGSFKTTVLSRPVGVVPVILPAKESSPATTPIQSVGRSPAGWAWPTNGILIGKFSSNGSLNKGIDIAGDLGQPVLAASDGSVVYAGSGLRGYGELVIIKHNDTYVSAYGHNRRLLVREGEQVKVGQTIAEMGSTGTDRVKLHFEIRRQGKPVDPLEFLPRR